MKGIPNAPAPGAPSCPTRYRTCARDLARLEPARADVAYVIGGLYGNLEALDALENLAECEASAGPAQS